MISQRNWLTFGLLLFGCLTLVIWRKICRISMTKDATSSAYKLGTSNTTGPADPFLDLPEKDYTHLIDLGFNFTLVNVGCNEDNKALLLLILVHTAPKHMERRITIRETWGKQNENFKLLFLVGSVNSTDLQNSLENESRLHNDIIQGSFVDSYRNLTYKHMMAFKYAIYHCPQAKYILKTDDDIFVNMPLLINFLTFVLSPYGTSNALFCTPVSNRVASRSYRSKWRLSFSEYPHKVFPTYCPGWAVLYSPDIVYALYKEGQKNDYFWIDDVYITGTLVEKLGISHSDIGYLVISEENLGNIVENSEFEPFLFGRGEHLEDNKIKIIWNVVTAI